MTEYSASTPTMLRVNDVTVVEYVTEPKVDPRRGPRSFAHPVRTLAGTVVTEVLPEDHLHHLGVSVAMQDVNGTNLWGGRTYVRDSGYQWLDDHGSIVGDAPTRTADGLTHRLRWFDPLGRTLLVEERQLRATALTGQPSSATARTGQPSSATALTGHPAGWLFDIAYTLTNPNDITVTLGSPGTNGRPGNAGYGGFFWRLPMAATPPATFNPSTDVEAEVNGSVAEWVAITGRGAADEEYSLVFQGLGDGDRWFVRASEYPGVCVALAFERTRPIEPGGHLARRHLVAVVDGAVSAEQAAALNAAAAASKSRASQP